MLFCIFRTIQEVCCSRKKRGTKIVPSSKLPWLWIGARFADGKIVNYTSEVNDVIEYGMKITPNILSMMTFIQQPVVWNYLDSETFEEKEFPSTGLVINGD
jgi:hypothetical protein